MSNKTSTKDIGDQGEKIAISFLEDKKYKILEKNFRAGRGEIDIIAFKDNIISFVEVKTKKFGDFGDPVTWITKSKQRQIGKIAQAYLIKKNIHDFDCRFDVIAIKWIKGSWEINHIENAFWL